MYTYGRQSNVYLSEAHPQLAELFKRALARSPVDVAIICGHRKKAEQDAAFESGNSKVKWPEGKHNRLPSEALDWMPHPMPKPKNGKKFTATEKAKIMGMYYTFNGVLCCEANHMGIEIRGGFDWDGDGDFLDQSFDDLGHTEIILSE